MEWFNARNKIVWINILSKLSKVLTFFTSLRCISCLTCLTCLTGLNGLTCISCLTCLTCLTGLTCLTCLTYLTCLTFLSCITSLIILPDYLYKYRVGVCLMWSRLFLSVGKDEQKLSIFQRLFVDHIKRSTVTIFAAFFDVRFCNHTYQ